MNGQQTILAEQQRINEQNLLRFSEIEQSANSLTSPAAAVAATDGTDGTDGQFVSRLDLMETQMSNLLGQINGDSSSFAGQIESLRASNAQERKDAMVELADALRNEQQNQLAEMKNSIASNREQELTQTTLAVREENQLAIESNARELRQELSGLQNQFSALSALSGDAESAVTLTTNLDDRIAALENSIANIDDNAVFKRIESRINQQIVDANEKLVTLQEQDDRQTDNVNNRLNSMEEQIQGLDGSLTERLNTTSPDQAQSEQSKEAVAALQAKVAELESRLQVTTSQFKIVSTRLDNLQKLGSLQNQPLANNVQQSQTSESDQQLAAANVQPESLENSSEESINRQSLARQDVSKGKAVEYKIYFAKDSTSISKAAEKVLKSFVAQEINRANRVSILGFTDRSGNAAYNQRLALRRANRVRSYLIQEGFDFRKFNAVDGLGEDLAASKTDDGQEDANQRTVVMYAYQ